MPSVITHCWYGDVAANATECNTIQQIIKNNHGTYMIGCQGPDPFFFYRRWPWKNSKEAGKVREYGQILHKKRINDFLGMFLDYVREKKDDVVTAYICGYLAHWSLDSVCHPYIFYMTDSVSEDVRNSHQLFEEALDRGVLAVNNLKTEDYQSRKLCVYPARLPAIVYEMMHPAFEKLAEINVTYEQIAESFRDFLGFQKLFYDPKGKMRKRMAVIEKLTGTKGLATSMIMPLKYDDVLDPMNFRQDGWCHPCDKEIVSHSSFAELGQQGVDRMLECFRRLDNFLYHDGKKEDLLAFVGDRDFETGMAGEPEMKYFKKDGIKV